MNESVLESFIEYVNGLGGDVVYADGYRLLNSPFSDLVGMNWETKIIFISDRMRNSTSCIVGAIHEAGHVFTSHGRPTLKSDEDEIYFLGWEYLLAMEVGVSEDEWLSCNSDYGVNGIIPDLEGEFSIQEMGDIPHERIKEFIDKIVSMSLAHGILSDMKPISVRGN